MSTVAILTGLPATGKSTLAGRLSSRLGWPLFSKDDIKEPMADALGTGDRQLSKSYGRASIAIQFRLLRRCLDSGTSALAETFFHGPLAVEAFRNLQGSTNCGLIQIVLHCDSRCPTLTVDSNDPGTIDIEAVCSFIRANS